MVEPQIYSGDCDHIEFGNPSAHTFGASLMGLTTAYLFVKHFCVKFNIKISLLPVMFVMNITFAVVNLVGFSRIFRGAHTYNQVFNGLVQGTILALIFGFVLYEDYFNFYMSLKNRSISSLVFN